MLFNAEQKPRKRLTFIDCGVSAGEVTAQHGPSHIFLHRCECKSMARGRVGAPIIE